MGPNYSISTACATANYAFVAAANHIRNGDADVMVAGGSEAPIIPVRLAASLASPLSAAEARLRLYMHMHFIVGPPCVRCRSATSSLLPAPAPLSTPAALLVALSRWAWAALSPAARSASATTSRSVPAALGTRAATASSWERAQVCWWGAWLQMGRVQSWVRLVGAGQPGGLACGAAGEGPRRVRHGRGRRQVGGRAIGCKRVGCRFTSDLEASWACLRASQPRAHPVGAPTFPLCLSLPCSMRDDRGGLWGL